MAKVTMQELAKYAVDQLEAGVVASEVSAKITSLLVAERRTRDAVQVMRAIEDELNKRGKTQVEITSAHGVTDEVKKQLATLLDAKNPTFHETIDPSVIGGVKAQAGERQIDLTVSTKLRKFKSEVMRSR